MKKTIFLSTVAFGIAFTLTLISNYIDFEAAVIVALSMISTQQIKNIYEKTNY